MQELWLSIPGHPGYEASDLGRVRSVARTKVCKSRNGGEHTRSYPSKILSPGKMNEYGHVSVTLGRDSGSLCVHYLVALTFIGPRPDAMDVCHRNGIGDDNTVANLYYGTRAQNIIDIAHHGRRKVTIEQVKEIRRRFNGTEAHAVSLAREFNISRSHVWNIVQRLSYAHVA